MLRKYTVLKMPVVRLICLVCCIFYSQIAYNQNSNNKEESTFGNVNFGVGSIYGGVGLNAEIGKKHISIFGSFGYAPERLVDEITLKPTWNYHTGFRYYFDIKHESIYPRAGVGFGWIANYYNTRIGPADYNQNVFGLASHVGLQFYSPAGLVISVDLLATARPFIVNVDQHPYFTKVYVRPTLGIGYDIQRLFKKRNKSVQNKTIDPFG